MIEEGNGIGGAPRSGRKGGGNDRSWMMIVYVRNSTRTGNLR